MNLTILGERRIRGDLIKTFKVVTGKVKYGQYIFKLSRSGNNIISKINNSVAREICKIRKSFLPERIRNYWKNLHLYLKMSENFLDFNMYLEKFKSQSVNNSFYNLWEVSNMIIDKIEGNPRYLENKNKFNNYLIENPFVAKKKGINIYIHT